MKKKEMTYETAMVRLEELVRQVESNEVGIDKLAELLKEAKALTEFCRNTLYATDEEIKKILQTEEKE